MAAKGQMTGMLGTYLFGGGRANTAGLVVSMASRNARGADLLVADQDCQRARSIQVKTNRKPASFWLLSKDFREVSSATHIYLFVNLRDDTKPDHYVVLSRVVKRLGETTSVGSI